MRVAMVAACPFPANHGTAGNIKEMAEALARRGHEVHIITYPMRHPIAVEGVTIHRVAARLGTRPITVGPTREKPLLDLLMVAAVIRCVRRERLDLIHAHNYEGALIGWMARQFVRRPLVYHAHNTMGDELPSYGFIRPRAVAAGLARVLDAIVPRMGDEVIVLSEELRSFVRARRVPAERITLVPVGVHPDMFDTGDGFAIRRRLGVGDAPLVMYTGTLDRFQRIDYLLQAMTRVLAALPAARLVLASNLAKDDDLAAVTAQAQSLGIADRTLVVHPMLLDDLPSFLAAADVTVCPRPACPGFPVKILNYMAARKPIVTARGSAKGLRHLETAYVADDHDWQGLATGIVELLEDGVLAKRLGDEARAAIVGTYDWSSLAARIEAVYDRVLSRA